VQKHRRPLQSNLKPGQQATLFPSFGYFDSRRECWRALIHGRVFDDRKIPLGTKILLGGLKRAMQFSPEDLASETFRSRIDGFLAAPGRRRKIVLEVTGHHYRLRRRTRRNGAFYGTLQLPFGSQSIDELPGERLTEASTNGHTRSAQILRMHLLHSVDALGSIRPASGHIHLVPPRGVSVISDIDDTIKLTEATSKRRMLENTFLKPFAAVEGMAKLYQAWQRDGCLFHYVSSSPWQLFHPLNELCENSRFPSGSMHLRYFCVRDEMMKRFRPIRQNTKVGIIAGILRRVPQRKFILVGDSGEKDPEIYRFLAKRFPAQVRGILIRNLEVLPLSDERQRKLKSLPPEVDVRVFRSSAEIADSARRLRDSIQDELH
jgi:hypothetical protein